MNPPDPQPVSAGDAALRPAVLIVNTRARRGRERFQDAVEAVQAAGIPLADACAVQSEDEAEAVLLREVREGAHLVIIGGGDGTLSSCAGRLVHTSTAMGVLPMGTGNTLARSLGVPLDLESAARVLASGRVELIDVGYVNGRVFVNSVTLGLSSEIASALTPAVKKRLGLMAWPVVGAGVLLRHRPIHLSLVARERSFEARTHQVVIANGRYIAGPVPAAPDASTQDVHLDVFVLGGSRLGSLFQTSWEWLRGHHVTSRSTRYFQTREIRVESRRGPLFANVDGEVCEQTPLAIHVEARALRVIVPHDFVPHSV